MSRFCAGNKEKERFLCILLVIVGRMCVCGFWPGVLVDECWNYLIFRFERWNNEAYFLYVHIAFW